MRRVAVGALNVVGILLALPFIGWAKLGQLVFRSNRFYMGAIYAIALFPGYPGMLIRRAFYGLVLPQCAWDLDMHFGSAVTQSQARIGRGVWIGAYSLVGRAHIGDETLIASRVSILSGARTHAIENAEVPIARQEQTLTEVRIGKGSWVGEGAIVMADIGDGAVVGAGSVVVKAVGDGAIAVGNPARVIRYRGTSQGLAGSRV